MLWRKLGKAPPGAVQEPMQTRTTRPGERGGGKRRNRVSHRMIELMVCGQQRPRTWAG
uniref:Uncharacterized protein n=1 Tax=Arundo donax TaxID=35708 RepID=A0A0A8YSX7_ARUDO